MFQTEVVEKIKINILCSINFFKENRAVYEKMLQNTVQPGSPKMTMWHMLISCWLSKATIHTPVMSQFLLFHCSIGCMNEPQSYIHVHCLSSYSKIKDKYLVMLRKSG
jgi:hypothetical protein